MCRYITKLENNSHYASFEIIDTEDENFVVISGSVKWDGCINWQTNSECMAHACDAEELKKQLELVNVVYAEAMKAMAK